MKILCLGDIVGPEAVDRLCKTLWKVRKERGVDFVMLNGENADTGNGLSRATAERLLAAGVDVITGGNHIFQKRELYTMLDDDERILRPANYPDEVKAQRRKNNFSSSVPNLSTPSLCLLKLNILSCLQRQWMLTDTYEF